MKLDVKSMTKKELESSFLSMGEKGFRARQVFRWLYKGITDFREMTNLPETLRAKLDEKAFIEKVEIQKVQISSKDGTRKYLFRLRDGRAVEGVFMKYKYGNAACISSQAGCRMGCVFCASGMAGLARNLTAGEMADEILAMERDTGERVGHLVVMGTGEPLDNYGELAVFLRNIHDEEGLNLSWRAITVSTCGLVPQIETFGDEFPQVNLAISLHASCDEERNALMPVNRKYAMNELLQACRRHAEKTGRRVTFEYTLIRGVNDGADRADRLADCLSGILCHVNLIPLNPVSEKSFRGIDRRAAEQFRKLLETRGIPATVRRSLGSDIDAACGQLRLEELKETKNTKNS